MGVNVETQPPDDHNDRLARCMVWTDLD